MYIYLPIAEQPIHSLVILGVGSIIGFIMGLVGVGGGFLLTPIMMLCRLTGMGASVKLRR